MAQPLPALQSRHAFPYWKWQANWRGLAADYSGRFPFPHIYLDQFLHEEMAHAMAREFPGPEADAWTHYQHPNENKLGMSHWESFPPLLKSTALELNSPGFVAWLSRLTGIRNLIADPALDGGGLHQASRGGFLNVHTDFTTHHYQKNWQRRVNLVLYLTPGWRAEWGGALEFWDADMRHCIVKYPCLFNRAVIFTTSQCSLHGFPQRLRCPEGVRRNSLALYYYTAEKTDLVPRFTNYRPRPSDKRSQAAIIWLDKQAVALYSRAKRRFGFSDGCVSRALRLFSRARLS